MLFSLVSNVGLVVVFVSVSLCIFRLFLVSCRFLYTLIALEQLKVILLMYSLIVGCSGELTYFVALLVMFTIEAVLGLVVLTRVWGSGSLIGLGCW